MKQLSELPLLLLKMLDAFHSDPLHLPILADTPKTCSTMYTAVSYNKVKVQSL